NFSGGPTRNPTETARQKSQESAGGQNSPRRDLSLPGAGRSFRLGATLSGGCPAEPGEGRLCAPDHGDGPQDALRERGGQAIPRIPEENRRPALGDSGFVVRGHLPDVVLGAGHGV